MIGKELDRIIIYDGLNCYDSCIITYLHHIGERENLIYDHLWEETDLVYDEINKCYLSRTFTDNLYHFFGISIKKQELEADEIMSLLDKEQIIMVKVDLIQYPFSPSFQQRSAPHYFLVHGYDESDNMILFSDPSRKHLNQKMEMKMLLDIQKEINVFSRNDGELTSDFCVADLIESCIKVKKRTAENMKKLMTYQSSSLNEYAD
jgi:hypothetical protein